MLSNGLEKYNTSQRGPGVLKPLFNHTFAELFMANPEFSDHHTAPWWPEKEPRANVPYVHVPKKEDKGAAARRESDYDRPFLAWLDQQLKEFRRKTGQNDRATAIAFFEQHTQKEWTDMAIAAGIEFKAKRSGKP